MVEPTYRVPHSSLQDGLSHSPAVRSSRPQSSGAGQGAKYPISPTINRTPPPTQFARGAQEICDTQFGRPSLPGWRRGCDKAAVTWYKGISWVHKLPNKRLCRSIILGVWLHQDGQAAPCCRWLEFLLPQIHPNPSTDLHTPPWTC